MSVDMICQEALFSPAISGHPVEVEARAATMSTSSPPDDPAVTSAALERLRRGGASSIPALADLLFSVGTNASARGDEAAALDALEECVDLRVGLFGGAGRPTLEGMHSHVMIFSLAVAFRRSLCGCGT